MAKDRSAPFSRKHRRYWLPVTGGMILIGAVNLGLGYCSWPGAPMDRTPERIVPQLPISEFARPDGGPLEDAAPHAPVVTTTTATAPAEAPRLPADAPAP